MSKCSFEPCEREVHCADLCSTHYMQQRKGKPLTPIRSYKRAVRGEEGRVCNNCGQYKLNDEYYSERKTACKECSRELYR